VSVWFADPRPACDTGPEWAQQRTVRAHGEHISFWELDPTSADGCAPPGGDGVGEAGVFSAFGPAVAAPRRAELLALRQERLGEVCGPNARRLRRFGSPLFWVAHAL
jgi:hypothetical protein